MAKVTITLESNGKTTEITESRNRFSLFGPANDGADLAALYLAASARAFGALQPEFQQFKKHTDALIKLGEELGFTQKEDADATV